MADPERYVVLGAGGHAKVVLDSILAAGGGPPGAILDADPKKVGQRILGHVITGTDADITSLAARGITHFVVGVGGAGDTGPRERTFELARKAGLEPLTVIHPSAIVAPTAHIGAGAQVLPRAVLNAESRIGVNAIINTGAIIEHDCVVGDHAHVASGAILASTVSVGRAAHVGAGAVVRQLVTIGDGALVAAGAVVVKDVPPHTRVMGVPAREVPK